MYDDWLYITPADFWLYQNITVTVCMFIGIIMGVCLQRYYYSFKLKKGHYNMKVMSALVDEMQDAGYTLIDNDTLP